MIGNNKPSASAGIQAMEDQSQSAMPLAADQFFIPRTPGLVLIHFFHAGGDIDNPKHTTSVSLPPHVAKALQEALGRTY